MYKKKPYETKLIIEGGRKLGVILDELIQMVRPGISTLEIDEVAERMIREVGGVPAFKGYQPHRSDPPFPGTICASINEEVVHGIPSKDRILKEGDIFTMDIGMKYPAADGYFTDTAVTVAVGEIPEKTRQLMNVTQKSMHLGIEQAKVGNTIADIGKVIEAYVDPQGYGIVRDLVGHGVGHAVHEEPRVPNFYDRDLENWRIEVGVVIAIEPMITLGTYEVETAADSWSILTRDKSLSAHYEHTVVVTEDGPVIATLRPSEMG